MSVADFSRTHPEGAVVCRETCFVEKMSPNVETFSQSKYSHRCLVLSSGVFRISSSCHSSKKPRSNVSTPYSIIFTHSSRRYSRPIHGFQSRIRNNYSIPPKSERIRKQLFIIYILLCLIQKSSVFIYLI
jgi:hypothetical protein